MTLLLKAQPLVDIRIAQMQETCLKLKAQGVDPKLVVVLIGDNPASISYVTNKRRLCEKVGASFELKQLPHSTSASDFKKIMKAINTDTSVHGCIIQLPVYGETKALRLEAMVDPAKDVDGFHPENTANLYLGRVEEKSLLPCTPKGIMSLLKYYKVELKGKNAVVIGRSQIVGKPISLMLNLAGVTVTMCHSETKDLKEHTQRADIVVSAVGKVNLLGAEHFDIKRKTVVIDVGMNKNAEGKLVGDCDFKSVAPVVGAITPVPGGVGPMTVLSLIENLLTAAQNQKDHV
ncbi:MAG: bifunctional 5,10-methylenetetrahydrofolate dehydrogenase/5,10-methenyltetrahydrofolate cyclohydrolase [Bacteriovoracaceae bacterium]|nr:bifunctional 5,10-methylenetetrahydrofolate dehydrogenase/5,10-methenyltetrahydrofolate cyclohydrolase [Bacteriovoracaceae bacterium]